MSHHRGHTRFAILVFACAALLGLGLSACSSDVKIPVLRVGYALHDHHAALFVAGSVPEWFAERGLAYLQPVVEKSEYLLRENERTLARISVESSTGGLQLVRKLHEQHFDLAFGGVPAMITMIDSGSPIRIIAPIMSGGAALVMAERTGVTDWVTFRAYLDSQREPVRIGYKTSVSVQNLLFERALHASGIEYSSGNDDPTSDVHLLNLHGAENLIPGIQNGIIDGMVVMQPYVALAEHEGVAHTVIVLDRLPLFPADRAAPCCALAIRDGALFDKHPEAIAAFVRLVRSAHEYIRAYPDRTAALVSRWLGTPVAVERRSIRTIRYHVDADASWDLGLEYWIATMDQLGMLGGEVSTALRSGSVLDAVYHREAMAKVRQYSP